MKFKLVCPCCGEKFVLSSKTIDEVVISLLEIEKKIGADVNGK